MSKKEPIKKRFIDNEDIKRRLAELHVKQLEELLQRLEDGIIEPQEMRLIWDMVKTHNIGIDSVDELVKKALENVEEKIEDLDLDEEWEFSGDQK